MPHLSLTDFVDVVSASGTPKATKIRQVKTRPTYSPAIDFWKPLREAIMETHTRGLPKGNLDLVLAGLTDRKKLTAYPPAIAGYKKWWGRSALQWFAPPSALYTAYGVDVSVNPELGLRVNGVPHIIKLYFKETTLTKNRVDIITYLMTAQLTQGVPGGCAMAVLDVRRGHLIVPAGAPPDLSAVLDAELAYVAALWPRL